MSQKTVLLTNALSFAGPPALQALWDDGYRVLAHDSAFADSKTVAQYQEKFPGIQTLSTNNPQELVKQAWNIAGNIDVLVSNDSFPAIHTPVDKAQIEDLRATLEHLVLFPFALLQEAIPLLKKQEKANVVFISSCRTELPVPGGAIPDMARAATNAFITSLSIELAPYGIPVNAIAPNYLYSEAYFPRAKFIENPVGSDFVKSVVPAGRLGRPEEIGELICYLANMKGSFHTGTIIKFAGGWPMAPAWPSL